MQANSVQEDVNSAGVLTAALLFFCLAWLSIEFTREFSRIALLWVANGVLLSHLLTSKRSSWTRLLLACFAANVLADWTSGDGLLKASLLSLCNSAEVLFIALALGGKPWPASEPVRWSHARDFLVFGVFGGSALAALLAAVSLNQLEGLDPLPLFKTWFMADAMGIALVTPLALTLRRAGLSSLRSQKEKWLFAGCLAMIAAVSAAVFSQSHYPILFVITPFLGLVAFQFGLFGLSIAHIVLAAVALVLTVAGLGPMALLEGSTFATRIFLVQLFVLFSQFTTVPLALAIEAKRRLEAQLTAANARLETLAGTDALTGLPNRRAFDSAYEREWATAQREKTSVSVALVDVDFFKAFNDTNGHGAGDLCLAQVGSLLAHAVFRPRDFVARYGGEEFVLIMPDTDAHGAGHVCERIRQAISTAGLHHSSSPISHVTVSIGVASICPDLQSSGQTLLGQADGALYEAKSKGRNRVDCAAMRFNEVVA